MFSRFFHLQVLKNILLAEKQVFSSMNPFIIQLQVCKVFIYFAQEDLTFSNVYFTIGIANRLCYKGFIKSEILHDFFVLRVQIRDRLVFINHINIMKNNFLSLFFRDNNRMNIIVRV